MSDSKKEKLPEPTTLAEVGERRNWGGDHFSSTRNSSPSQTEDKYFAGTVPPQQATERDLQMFIDLVRQTNGEDEED
jgi:hypothetical protein